LPFYKNPGGIPVVGCGTNTPAVFPADVEAYGTRSIVICYIGYLYIVGKCAKTENDGCEKKKNSFHDDEFKSAKKVFDS